MKDEDDDFLSDKDLNKNYKNELYDDFLKSSEEEYFKKESPKSPIVIKKKDAKPKDLNKNEKK